MSLEIELREVAWAQQGCREKVKESSIPARNKHQARVRPIRRGIQLWPVCPASRQFDPLSLSLFRDENTIGIQSFAPNNNSSAIRPEWNRYRNHCADSMA